MTTNIKSVLTRKKISAFCGNALLYSPSLLSNIVGSDKSISVSSDGIDSGVSPGNLETSTESDSCGSPDMSSYRFAKDLSESLPTSDCIPSVLIHSVQPTLNGVTAPVMFTANSSQKLVHRGSPIHDLGYHTLVTSASTPEPWRSRIIAKTPKRCSPFPESLDMNILSSCPTDSARPRPPEVPQICSISQTSVKNASSLDKIPDRLMQNIFSYLPIDQLFVCARVCKKWRCLVWDPKMWTTIKLNGENLNADRVLKAVTRTLAARSTSRFCTNVERIVLNGCSRLSDTGLSFLAKKCSYLRHIELRGCVKITSKGVAEVLAGCLQLCHLDLTGCSDITLLPIREYFHNEDETPMQHLQFLDLTDCRRIEDNVLKGISKFSPQLQHLYLRRCVNITGLRYISSLDSLKEVSISDCPCITDYGLYQLANIGPALRYLSVAKCDRVSDAGIIHIARHCYRLRYLNVRGCEAVSDHAVEALSQGCPRLRALDIGKCDVTDIGLKSLARGCLNLKRLSVRGCEQITENGLKQIALCCRGLQQLSLQECTSVSPSGYRMLRQNCRRCVIEHNNPAFL